MDRVVITRPVVGIGAMQVCAISDATDEEILEVCNRENPSGTTCGWGTVVRKHLEPNICIPKNNAPVTCADDLGRTHFLVLC